MDVSTTDGAQGLQGASSHDGAGKSVDGRVIHLDPDQVESSLQPAARSAVPMTASASSAFSALALAVASTAWAGVEGAVGLILRQLGNRQRQLEVRPDSALAAAPKFSK